MIKGPALRVLLFERQAGKCFWCQEPMHMNEADRLSKDYATIEHIIPRHYGGQHTRANLALAHRGCNNSRTCNVKIRVDWIQRARTLLEDAAKYLEGMEVADDINKFIEQSERVEAALFKTLRDKPDEESTAA